MIDTAEFSGWPSGDCKPVLELTFTPEVIESKWNIHFQRDRDDLNWYFGRHVKDRIIGFIAMMQYENSQSVGTVLYVDSKISTPAALKRIRSKFVITDCDIVWESSGT